MNRRARVLPLLLLPPLLLTACGTQRAADGPVAAAAPTEAAPAGAEELENRAQALGIAPDLVYVTRAPGLTLAQQSVGVLGDDGFSATYLTGSGALVRLSVERGSMTEDTCPGRPVGDSTGGRATCERDADAWYRTGGGQHEYALPKNGHVVRLSAEADAVPREVLSEAAEAVHRPDNAEAAATLPSPRPAAGTPVERGDLPPVGDGAPDNSVDVGG
ncbi:hypothetical protein [Streptomyces flaveolus]|uniref:hypothetical protein n=1 Tax=Streptomyces flaveolus TaxID=67297 RepID=UPI00166F772B|nr:hypothetical protein [Streptomyces flaveolus]GGQ79403.1 membrane protein [Streptomyces flaveolus]